MICARASTPRPTAVFSESIIGDLLQRASLRRAVGEASKSRAPLDDVRAFHATYYRPDNAVLVVSGNFDEEILNRWVDRYFGPIQRPDRPIPRVTAEEPERTQAAAFTVYEPNTPLPAVLISYPVPPVTHEDSAALEVLDGILSTGESSRLHRSVVYEQRLASQASSFPDMRTGQGNLVVYAILSEGQSPGAGMAALRREVASFRDASVTAAEIDEARRISPTLFVSARRSTAAPRRSPMP